MPNSHLQAGRQCNSDGGHTSQNCAQIGHENKKGRQRVKLYNGHIVLEPENPMYKPFVYRNEEMNSVRILGKAVAFTSAVK